MLDREIPGFVANRHPRRRRATRRSACWRTGIASVEDIDTACRTALGYPMGPFELMDLTGIDIGYYVKVARYEGERRPRRPAQQERRRERSRRVSWDARPARAGTAYEDER